MIIKSENNENPVMPSQMVLPTVDVEYLYRFERTVALLEQGLHNDDDPEKIARQTIEVARDFYDAEWCGLLRCDLDAGVFYPYWWSNRAEGSKAATRFDEFEFSKDYVHWADALEHGKTLILNGLEHKTEAITKREFQHYQKLGVRSVIGVPLFYHKPCGFMVVKNPEQYASQSEMLAILGYVVLNCWKEQQNMEALQLQMKIPCAELKTDRDVYLRLFGEPEIHTLKGQLSAQTLNSPKGWRLLTYLALHKKAVPLRTIVDALSSDDDPEHAGNALRVVMSRMKPKLEPILNPAYSLITNTRYGYTIDSHYHVITDLDEFERLLESALKQKDISPRIDELKKAVKLYRAPVYEEASSEHWLISTREYYAVLYLKAVKQLLKDLAELKDYFSVQHYAAEASALEPENECLIYWLIYALVKAGSRQSAEIEYNRAKEILTETQLDKLNRKLYELEQQEK